MTDLTPDRGPFQLAAEIDRLRAENAELLAALMDIVRAEWTTVTLQKITPQHRARLEAARAAIAKATT